MWQQDRRADPRQAARPLRALMATTPVDYAKLVAEPYWAREFSPPNLNAFYIGLRTYLGRGADAVGGKGDNRHRYGYHRSREWVLNSAYSVYHAADYSVTHPLDQGGDDRWLSALDATPFKVETLIGMCQRLDAAVKAGRCPQVREWYGNLGTDAVVDGWDNVRDRAASSDSSHLWHLHISFFRSRADWDHSGLLAVLTGDNDMITGPELAAALRWALDPTNAGTNVDARVTQAYLRAIGWQYVGGGIDAGMSTLGVLNAIHQASKRPPADLMARMDTILAAALDDTNTTVVASPEMVAELVAVRAALVALPDAVADEQHQRQAE